MKILQQRNKTTNFIKRHSINMIVHTLMYILELCTENIHFIHSYFEVIHSFTSDLNITEGKLTQKSMKTFTRGSISYSVKENKNKRHVYVIRLWLNSLNDPISIENIAEYGSKFNIRLFT